MPCRSPLQGYYTPDGKIEFGKRSESMGRFGLVTLNCGVCRDCRLRRAREWAIRSAHEAQLHESSCFIDLTFAIEPEGVCKRDLQLFFKRLRKALSPKRIKYFAVGEYGENFSRPHYHVCLYGHDFPDKYPWRKSKKGVLLYRSPQLESVWKYGHSTVSVLTPEAAGYAARYTLKKITGDLADEHYNGKEPEFQIHSNALGRGWIEKYWPDVVRSGFVVYKGKECPVPTYYLRWLKEHQPEAYEKLVERRSEYFEQLPYETGSRLHFAAQARDSRTKSLARDYETGAQRPVTEDRGRSDQ